MEYLWYIYSKYFGVCNSSKYMENNNETTCNKVSDNYLSIQC